jgi:hypothetical protein
MGLFDEFRESGERFRNEIESLRALLGHHDVKRPTQLLSLYRQDPAFKTEWNAIWTRLGKDNRGKLSLTTAGAILGAALGGMGIAALGGAIGVPLLAVLGVGGLLAGTEVDAGLRKGEFVKVELPVAIHERLCAKAKEVGEEPTVLLAKILDTTLGGPDNDGATP